MEVKVKVLDVEEGKIRLSMKQAEMDGSELDQKEDDSEKIESKLEYHDDEEATTTLGSLLAGIKIDE